MLAQLLPICVMGKSTKVTKTFAINLSNYPKLCKKYFNSKGTHTGGAVVAGDAGAAGLGAGAGGKVVADPLKYNLSSASRSL